MPTTQTCILIVLSLVLTACAEQRQHLAWDQLLETASYEAPDRHSKPINLPR